MPTTDRPAGRLSARWRIVGWIVLTTALALLAVTVTTRSILLGQVAEQANAGIVQEIDEFSTFAREGVDPETAAPFSSTEELVERYLRRQTPATGEAILGVTGEGEDARVQVSDNASGNPGEELARDRPRLERILQSSATSGVDESVAGGMRWGKATVDTEQGQKGTLVVIQFVGAAEEEVESQIVVLFAVATGGLLLTAGIAYLVAGRILHPLRSIRRVADSVHADDLTARVPVEGDDEVSHLAATVNRMLDRVAEAHASQRHFAVEARRHLDEPRQQVLAALDTLQADGSSPEGRRRAGRTAARELEYMRRTMLELETLAVRHSSDFVQARDISATELTARVYTEAASGHTDRRWDLAATADGRVWVDPERVREAMRQLTENAVQHGGADDVIRIGSRMIVDDSADGGQQLLRLWVTNPSPRISQDEARLLLETVRSTETEGRVGMGFGLAVVRAVADAHDGSAWVESSDEDGTTFGIDLPTRALAPDETTGAQRLRDQVSKSMREET